MNAKQLAALIAALSGSTVKVKAASKARKGQMTSDKLAAMTISAFTKAGYKVSPADLRVNILTHGGFKAKGLAVRHGEHGVKCGPYTLFHVSQTQPQAEYDAEAAKRQGGKAPTAAPKVPTIEELEALLAQLKGKQVDSAALEAEYGPKV